MGAALLGRHLLKKETDLDLNQINNSASPSGFVENFISNSTSYSKTRLPAELLILNRYGVGYPYLKAAWKLSQQHQIAPYEILIKAKVISLETWLDAQDHLSDERERVIGKRRQEILLLNQSISNLSDNLPHYSAKQTFTGWQIIFIGFFVISTSWFLYINYQNAILAIFMVLTFFYMASIFLRGLLLASFQPAISPTKDLLARKDEDLPIYSVLVALYKEANQIDALTQNLWQLDWPKDKLDIKLICEADDCETIEAIVDAKLPSCFELVQVLPTNPRTKPKALNYALPLCKGEYLVLYDAEDHPSSGQLREAFLKFSSEDEKLACLQAPLHIHNHKQNWLSAMFAIEYVTLFNGILPVLAKWHVPIPLGGTSNHFNGVMYQKQETFQTTSIEVHYE